MNTEPDTEQSISLEAFTEPVFGRLTESVMRLGLRVLHQRLNLLLLNTERLDIDALQALWDVEWKEHGKEYNHLTFALQMEDTKVINEARLNWAIPAINKEIADKLGELYLSYDVSKIPRRDEILKSSSLIITGGVGTGKTMALAWRCQALAMEKALSGDFNSMEDLLAVYPSGELFNRLHKAEPISDNALILAIDDYGTEYVEPFALSQFELLIEKRYARRLVTLMTTNIPQEQFKTRKGFERIESRLLKRCTFVSFGGIDRRKVVKDKEAV